jgi:hypothetical protein
MTDEAMKDLVTKHDATLMEYGESIKRLTSSLDNLVQKQGETNEKLSKITEYLAEQKILSLKVQSMDSELRESFKRVHKRIDSIDELQTSDNGCNSVRLLTKDVNSTAKDVTKLIGTTEEHRLHIEAIDNKLAASIPPAMIRWAVALIVTYSVMFGTYVVQTFSKIDKTNTRITALLERDLKDTEHLMRVIMEKK